mgnify:CR=1 FL=1
MRCDRPEPDSRLIFLRGNVLPATVAVVLFRMDSSRPVAKSAEVKCQARGVQLLDDGNVWLLLRDQNSNVAAAKGCGIAAVKRVWSSAPRPTANPFQPALASPMAILQTGRHTEVQHEARRSIERQGVGRQPAIQARLELPGWLVSLDRDFENLFQSNGAGGDLSKSSMWQSKLCTYCRRGRAAFWGAAGQHGL